MYIEHLGIYGTRGYEAAEIYAIDVAFCVGYVIPSVGKQRFATWRVIDGARLNGPQEEDLVALIRARDARPIPGYN